MELLQNAIFYTTTNTFIHISLYLLKLKENTHVCMYTHSTTSLIQHKCSSPAWSTSLPVQFKLVNL